MIVFQVNDMTCGHCVRTLTEAVKVVDKDAKVQIDLPSHRVHVESGTAEVVQLADAIEKAGYTPALVQAASVPSSKPAGSCCGCCR